ncbi:MAG: tetratricopeptide repeat protein [Pirellulaceae bacterium]
MSSRRRNRPSGQQGSRWENLVRRAPVAALILCLATAVVYCRSTSAPFVFDSLTKIEENEAIRRLWPPTWLTFDRRPVAYFTFALNYAQGGASVFGFHVVNIGIHMAAACVLLGIARRTFDRSHRRPWREAAGSLAFSIALLWAVHPLQTQSVAYTVQRIESLMGLLFLLTLYAFVRAAESDHRRWWLAASVVSCYLAIATKEVAAMAPLLVLWYDRAFVAQSWRQIVRERVLYYAALAGSWAMLGLLMATRWSTYSGRAGAVAGLSSWEYLRSQPGVLLHYLRLVVWPRGQCLDYGWPVADSALEIALPGLVVVALLGLTVWAMFRRPRLSFLGGWFFLILAPTSSIVPIFDLAFEHRMYLPLAAPIALIVVGLFQCLLLWKEKHADSPGEPSDALLALVAPLAVVLLCVGHLRAQVYATEESVWSDVVAKAPRNPRGYLNLAGQLRERDAARARRLYETAQRLDPGSTAALHILVVDDEAAGNYEAAEETIRQAIADCEAKGLSSGFHRILMGEFLLRRQRPEEAVTWLEEGVRALRATPDVLDRQSKLAQALVSLGTAQQASDNREGAIASYQAAIEVLPEFAHAHALLGQSYMQRGDVDSAILHWRRAAAADPDWADIQMDLMRALLRQGNADGALRRLEAYRRLRPDELRGVSNAEFLQAMRQQIQAAATPE